MLAPSLAFGIAFNLCGAAVCFLIGRRLARRHVEDVGAQRASALFSVWWLGMSGNILANNATWLLAAFGLAPAWAVVALTFASLACGVAMIWGLVYYLVYLFTGRPGVFWPITLFYGASLAGSFWLIASLRPTGVRLGEWGGAVEYASQPAPLLGAAFSLFFLLPPIVGALAYGTLAFRVKHPFRRFRIAVVSLSLLVWLISSLALPSGGSSGATRAVGMIIAVLALTGLGVAYFPPRRLRARLDADGDALHAVHEGMPDGLLVQRPDRAARRAALLARAQDLI